MRWRWLLVFALVFALAPGRSWGQPQATESPSVTIHSIKPSTEGVTMLLETVDPDLLADGVVASIDGVAVPASMRRLSRESGESLVILMETSSSMYEELVVEARQVAGGILDTVSPATRFKLVTFANEFTVVEEGTVGAVTPRLIFDPAGSGGGSALFDAVAEVADVIEASGAETTIVVLTFGWDFGGVSTIDREGAIAQAVSPLATYHVVILGSSYDRGFFETLTSETGGRLILDGEQLGPVELVQGGARWEVRIDAPDLEPGTHTVNLSTTMGVHSTLVTEIFEVELNDALQLTVQETDAPSDLIIVEVGGAEAQEDATLSVFAASESVSLDPAVARVTLDPWMFDPGPLRVRVEGTIDRQIVAERSVIVPIPVLTPHIAVSVIAPDGILVAEVVGQVQAEGARIRITSGARELVVSARRGRSTVLLALEDWEGATAQLETADGVVIGTATITPIASDSASELFAWMVVLMVVVVTAVIVGASTRMRLLGGGAADSQRRGVARAMIVGTLGAVVSLVVLVDGTGPGSMLLMVVFVLIGPGLAAVNWLPNVETRDWLLVPAIGLSATTLFSLGMLYVGWWAPNVLLVTLAAASVAVALAGAYRVSMRSSVHRTEE